MLPLLVGTTTTWFLIFLLATLLEIAVGYSFVTNEEGFMQSVCPAPEIWVVAPFLAISVTVFLEGGRQSWGREGCTCSGTLVCFPCTTLEAVTLGTLLPIFFLQPFDPTAWHHVCLRAFLWARGVWSTLWGARKSHHPGSHLSLLVWTWLWSSSVHQGGGSVPAHSAGPRNSRALPSSLIQMVGNLLLGHLVAS